MGVDEEAQEGVPGGMHIRHCWAWSKRGAGTFETDKGGVSRKTVKGSKGAGEGCGVKKGGPGNEPAEDGNERNGWPGG